MIGSTFLSRSGYLLATATLLAAAACGDEAASPTGSPGNGGQAGVAGSNAGTGGSNAGAGGSSAGAGGPGTGGSNAGTGGASAGAGGSSAGAGGSSAGAGGSSAGGSGASAAPFWDASNIPPAKNVMMFKFLNRTNGQFSDAEVFWRFEHEGIKELHSIAEQPTYDMPANSSGRMYFFLCAKNDATCAADPSKSKYYDFIEHTIGPDQYNGNTTRVDAWGLKIALLLRANDGWEKTVGETEATFAESRDATFAAFLAQAPAEFKACASPPHAPYRIVEPGACGFNKGGEHAAYYDTFVDELWSVNGITIPKPGPNGSGLGSYPNLSAAIYRHVGNVAGTFAPDGKLLNEGIWKDPKTFYTKAPANYYARFWHERGIDGRAYGFPYDDVGSYSTYVSRKDPQYMLVAIGY